MKVTYCSLILTFCRSLVMWWHSFAYSEKKMSSLRQYNGVKRPNIVNSTKITTNRCDIPSTVPWRNRGSRLSAATPAASVDNASTIGAGCAANLTHRRKSLDKVRVYYAWWWRSSVVVTMHQYSQSSHSSLSYQTLMWDWTADIVTVIDVATPHLRLWDDSWTNQLADWSMIIAICRRATRRLKQSYIALHK